MAEKYTFTITATPCEGKDLTREETLEELKEIQRLYERLSKTITGVLPFEKIEIV